MKRLLQLAGSLLVGVFLFPAFANATTYATANSGDTQWRCFASTQDAAQFYIDFGVPIASFPTYTPEALYGINLKLGSWHYTNDQGFYLVATTTPNHISVNPTFDGAISSNETYYRDDLPTLAGFTPPLSESSPADVWYSFSANTLGYGMATGTMWFRLVGTHPSNAGDRACVRASGSGTVGRTMDYFTDDTALPTFTLYYINTGGDIPLAEFPTLNDTIASGTTAFDSAEMAEWCAGLHTTGTWISDISSSIGSALCRVGVELVIPSATTTNALIAKKSELMTQFPLSLVGSLISVVSSTVSETSVSSTELSFSIPFSTSSFSNTTSVSFAPVSQTRYEALVSTSTRMLFRTGISLAIWWGALFSVYALGMALFRKKHE